MAKIQKGRNTNNSWQGHKKDKLILRETNGM
jgi:hypothetical protein